MRSFGFGHYSIDAWTYNIYNIVLYIFVSYHNQSPRVNFKIRRLQNSVRKVQTQRITVKTLLCSYGCASTKGGSNQVTVIFGVHVSVIHTGKDEDSFIAVKMSAIT